MYAIRNRQARLILLATAAMAALVTGCGGGGDDAQASRVQPLRANEPIVITSHGPNPVSVWSAIGFATANAPASPAGATSEVPSRDA